MSKLEQGKKFQFKDMISDCKKLYEIYSIDKAILIGQSMGGNVAQHLAYYCPELVDKLVLIDCSKNTGKLTAIEIMMELIGCMHEDVEFKFKQPVLLICGSDDKLGNIKKIAEPWARGDSNCTLHMIDNAGHNSNQDKPEIINELIYSFLNS